MYDRVTSSPSTNHVLLFHYISLSTNCIIKVVYSSFILVVDSGSVSSSVSNLRSSYTLFNNLCGIDTPQIIFA